MGTDTLRTCENLLATLSAADGHLRTMASLQLDFPSVVRMYRRAVERSQALLESVGYDEIGQISLSDLGRDDTDELLSRAVSGDLGDADDNTDEQPRLSVAETVSQDSPNAPAVPIDDGPEGTADTQPLATDEESAEVPDLDLEEDDLILDEPELVPDDTEETDPAKEAETERPAPTRGAEDVVVMEEDDEDTDFLPTPPVDASAMPKEEEDEETLVVDGAEIEQAARKADGESDEEDTDAGSVSEVILTKEDARKEVAEKRSRKTPAQGTQRKAAPKVKPKVKAAPKKPARSSAKDSSAKFYAASAAIPTIRDDSTPKPRAAAIQLNAEGSGAKMLGDEAEDEPIAVGGVEDEDMLDMDVDGLTLAVEEAWDEAEWEDEDEEDADVMELDAESLEMVEEVVPPSITAEELEETLARARRAAKQGNIEAGVNFYSDVLDADPDHTTAYIGRGRLYLDLGDYSRAMSDFTVAEDLDPDSPEPQVAVGDLYFARKDYRKAIEYFDAALEMQADHAMAYCRRGISHYYKRNYKQALADLTEAVRLDPDIPNISTFVSMAKKKAARQR